MINYTPPEAPPDEYTATLEYAVDLWYESWPEVPWAEASPEDRVLFFNHAQSLRTYALTTGNEL